MLNELNDYVACLRISSRKYLVSAVCDLPALPAAVQVLASADVLHHLLYVGLADPDVRQWMQQTRNRPLVTAETTIVPMLPRKQQSSPCYRGNNNRPLVTAETTIIPLLPRKQQSSPCYR